MTKDIFCFSSVSTDKEILYIVILSVFEDENKKHNIKIRYYIINIFGLYHYKFYSDLRLEAYKESLVLASSFYEPKENSSQITDNYYSSFIIFSYPNSTDVNKDLIDVLLENNEVL